MAIGKLIQEAYCLPLPYLEMEKYVYIPSKFFL